MGHEALRVYLRLATRHVAIDSPTLRLGALAHAALSDAGARVMLSDEGGTPGTPRDVALSWAMQHDLLLRDLRGTGPTIRATPGEGIVLSDEFATVARSAVPGISPSAPALWAAPASCLLDPSPTPPAALTLTAADARAFRASGIMAASLIAWPSPRDGLADLRRVVIAVAADAQDALGAVVDAVASGLPGRPVIDVVADAPLVLDGVRHAARHPWVRSRLARSADLVLVLGRSAGTDLVAAEATLGGAMSVRVIPGRGGEAPLASLGSLAEALPPGFGLGPVDPGSDAGTLHVPQAALARWLVDVSGSTPGPWGEDG